jgi:hypothetical protein
MLDARTQQCRSRRAAAWRWAGRRGSGCRSTAAGRAQTLVPGASGPSCRPGPCTCRSRGRRTGTQQAACCSPTGRSPAWCRSSRSTRRAPCSSCVVQTGWQREGALQPASTRAVRRDMRGAQWCSRRASCSWRVAGCAFAQGETTERARTRLCNSSPAAARCSRSSRLRARSCGASRAARRALQPRGSRNGGWAPARLARARTWRHTNRRRSSSRTPCSWGPTDMSPCPRTARLQSGGRMRPRRAGKDARQRRGPRRRHSWRVGAHLGVRRARQRAEQQCGAAQDRCAAHRWRSASSQCRSSARHARRMTRARRACCACTRRRRRGVRVRRSAVRKWQLRRARSLSHACALRGSPSSARSLFLRSRTRVGLLGGVSAARAGCCKRPRCLRACLRRCGPGGARRASWRRTPPSRACAKTRCKAARACPHAARECCAKSRTRCGSRACHDPCVRRAPQRPGDVCGGPARPGQADRAGAAKHGAGRRARRAEHRTGAAASLLGRWRLARHAQSRSRLAHLPVALALRRSCLRCVSCTRQPMGCVFAERKTGLGVQSISLCVVDELLPGRCGRSARVAAHAPRLRHTRGTAAQQRRRGGRSRGRRAAAGDRCCFGPRQDGHALLLHVRSRHAPACACASPCPRAPPGLSCHAPASQQPAKVAQPARAAGCGRPALLQDDEGAAVQQRGGRYAHGRDASLRHRAHRARAHRVSRPPQMPAVIDSHLLLGFRGTLCRLIRGVQADVEARKALRHG